MNNISTILIATFLGICVVCVFIGVILMMALVKFIEYGELIRGIING